MRGLSISDAYCIRILNVNLPALLYRAMGNHDGQTCFLPPLPTASAKTLQDNLSVRIYNETGISIAPVLDFGFDAMELVQKLLLSTTTPPSSRHQQHFFEEKLVKAQSELSGTAGPSIGSADLGQHNSTSQLGKKRQRNASNDTTGPHKTQNRGNSSPELQSIKDEIKDQQGNVFLFYNSSVTHQNYLAVENLDSDLDNEKSTALVSTSGNLRNQV